ncbi:hypothetical protein J6590_015132 [Homalodisca vitripennis]|nr:hypothetical protein J6590_015132 [Homalodisca vitripennis]
MDRNTTVLSSCSTTLNSSLLSHAWEGHAKSGRGGQAGLAGTTEARNTRQLLAAVCNLVFESPPVVSVSWKWSRAPTHLGVQEGEPLSVPRHWPIFHQNIKRKVNSGRIR